jgi:ATP-dependent Clp protease protease subunit
MDKPNNAPLSPLDAEAIKKFAEGRNLFLVGEVNDEMAQSLLLHLLLLNFQDQETPITLYINSPGGSVQAGLMILDTIDFIQAPVRTVCVGMAASMASLILAAGEPGERAAFQHALVMVHQPLVFSPSESITKASEYQAEAERIQKQRNLLESLYAAHCPKELHHDLAYYHQLTEIDNYMSADEALKAGLIDKVIQGKHEEY